MTVRFGAFALDSDRRQLTRRGDDIHLTPKAFDLLVLLADQAPRVVRKSVLHERLWPGTFVSDATLVGLVKELRRALDDRDPRTFWTSPACLVVTRGLWSTNTARSWRIAAARMARTSREHG
jgi:DNA-binding winged helix-turn-helix (wHTH) protein